MLLADWPPITGLVRDLWTYLRLEPEPDNGICPYANCCPARMATKMVGEPISQIRESAWGPQGKIVQSEKRVRFALDRVATQPAREWTLTLLG